MWWQNPMHREFAPLLSVSFVTTLALAYSMVERRAIAHGGPKSGRVFEQAFYALCRKSNLRLSEKSASHTVAGQKSASGFWHEVDGGTRSLRGISHWELKHLTQPVSKNDLLIFNGKSLDFLHGSNQLIARVPFYRFLVSGGPVDQVSRFFAALWGIMIIEPGRLPLPLIYEASARGAAGCLSSSSINDVKDLLRWACRPLQFVLRELAEFSIGQQNGERLGPDAVRAATRISEIHVQLSDAVLDYLEELHPNWLDNAGGSEPVNN
jgi:hypothetical protein